MAVRIKLELKSQKGKKKGAKVESSALINSGFETEAPEIVLPITVAQRLGLWPELPGGTTVEKYEVAGGGKFDCYLIEDAVGVRVITEDKATDPIATSAVLMQEREILISDKLTSRHHIVIEDLGEGLWRFRSEEKIRKSEAPEYW